jgi:hypothetical protein
VQWFYVDAGSQRGPLPETEFRELIERGQVTRSTLVWCEGLKEWQPLQDVDPALLGSGTLSGLPAAIAAAPPIAASSPHPERTCVECGREFVPEDLVTISGSRVCATCKPLFLQRLQQGAPLSGLGAAQGVYRLDRQLVVQTGGILPPRCVCCNAPATVWIKRKFLWHPPWVWALILCNLIVLVVVALITRKTMTLEVPLCAEHAEHRHRQRILAWILAAIAIALPVSAFVLGANWQPAEDWGFITIFPGLLVLALAGWIGSRASNILSPAFIGKTGARFKRVSPDFLVPLEPWLGGKL